MKYFIPLIFAALIFAAAAAGYGYLWLQVNAMVEHLASLSTEGTQAQARETFTRAAEGTLANLTVEREQLTSFVPQDADFVSVINLIEAAARREKIVAEIGSVTVVQGGGMYHDAVSVALSAKGSFANVATFLAALETLPFASRLTEVSFETSADKSWFASAKLAIIKKKP